MDQTSYPVWVWVLGLALIILPFAIILSVFLIGIVGVITFAIIETQKEKKNRQY